MSRKSEMNNTWEVDARKQDWMTEVSQLSPTAHRLVVKHFKPTSFTIPFVKKVTSSHHLFIESFNQDLVLRKILPEQ